MAETAQKAPLEDLMVAMDVVDTLRHQQSIADRELDAEARRERLLQRLKDMYQAQGIEVPEQVLLEGIAALEEERFSYTPVPRSWRTSVANLWVSRKKWGKPIGLLATIAAALWGVYFALEVMPQRSLPSDITDTVQLIKQQAKQSEVVSQAEQIAAGATIALKKDQVSEAQSALENLQDISERLAQEYTLRVVSDANGRSAVWRLPPGDGDVRNFYLLIEAIDSNNRAVELNVINEEDNKSARKKVWGLRVSEETFYSVARDKQDDGIIQNNKVGMKRAGYLMPEFSVPTTGATITEW